MKNLTDYQIQQLHCMYNLDDADKKTEEETIPFDPYDSYLLSVYPSKQFTSLYSFLTVDKSDDDKKKLCQALLNKFFPHLTDINNPEYYALKLITTLDNIDIDVDDDMVDIFPFPEEDVSIYGYQSLIDFMKAYAIQSKYVE